MDALIAVVLVALAGTLVESQVPFWGRCPLQPVKKNFQPSRYLGRWYEQYKYFAVFELGGSCVTADYSNLGNGIIGVENRQYNMMKKRMDSIKGTAKAANPSRDAKLKVSFPNAKNEQESNYWVLDTDYLTYSIVWSCTEVMGHMNLQFLWVLTRAKDPPSQVISLTRGIIASRYLSTEALRRTTQDCTN